MRPCSSLRHVTTMIGPCEWSSSSPPPPTGPPTSSPRPGRSTSRSWSRPTSSVPDGRSRRGPGGRGAVRRPRRRGGDCSPSLDDRGPIDAVVAVDDEGVVVAAHAAQRLGLPHNPPDAAARTRDKQALRATRSTAARFPNRDTRRVVDLDHLPDVGFPCVVKPATLVGEPGRDPSRRSRGRARAAAQRADDDRVRRAAARGGVRPRLSRSRSKAFSATGRSTCSRSSTSPTRSTGRTSRRRSTSRRRGCRPIP